MGFVQTDADLRSLVTGARDIIYACDATGHFTFANPFATELMGYSEHEILGRHFLTLVRDDYREAATKFYGRQFVARVLDTYFEFPAVVKTGEVLWLGQHVQLIVERDAIVGFQAIARDITKQKDAEDRLRASEAAYRSLVQGASVGIFRATLEGQFIEVNPAFAAMLGYDSPATVIAQQSAIGLYANAADRAPIVGKLLSEGRVDDAEVHWKRRDGSPITVRINARAVRGAGGAVDAVEVIVKDVTERLRQEEQRLRSHTLEAVGNLAAGVAHHFNNLLTGMLGYTELLGSQKGVSEEMRADLSEILKAGRRASVLTHQLLAFSDPKTPRPEMLDLNHVLHGLEGRLRRELRDGQTLVVESAPLPAMIKVDSEDLQQVITQVVRNARDAMPNGGAVRIGVEHVSSPEADLAGDYVRLHVADSGTGMDWETQSRMFEPFFTTKRQDEGTGLGLSVTHGIVRNCGGSISVDSHLGRGTKVNVYFPA
jgi:two-component system, cell cycle sensor histidine kinase and response regulator CckA